MLLGCIGDDFTGSSDLGNTLSKSGMHVVQYSGIPDKPADTDVEAGIIALKSRSIPADEAIAQSLRALEWLKAQGCQQFFFKYCSTFDSTPEGNIGPVAQALAQALSADQVIFCPAFPTTGRSIFQGHLFVGDQLLSDSPLKDHPLNPMSESDLRKWLALQTKTPVGHVTITDVMAGVEKVKSAMQREAEKNGPYMIVDAIQDSDLMTIGAALKGVTLVTGGSGVAIGLPQNFDALPKGRDKRQSWQGKQGPSAALCGSCAAASRRQIARHTSSGAPVLKLDSQQVIEGSYQAADAYQWICTQWRDQPDATPLVYSSADPAEVKSVQEKYGAQTAAAAFEGFFGALAKQLVAGNIERLIVAGGETSGAVVEALLLPALVIGPEIDPGVPALAAEPSLNLALKSGNFGAEDFFEKAAAVLAGQIER